MAISPVATTRTARIEAAIAISTAAFGVSDFAAGDVRGGIAAVNTRSIARMSIVRETTSTGRDISRAVSSQTIENVSRSTMQEHVELGAAFRIDGTLPIEPGANYRLVYTFCIDRVSTATAAETLRAGALTSSRDSLGMSTSFGTPLAEIDSSPIGRYTKNSYEIATVKRPVAPQMKPDIAALDTAESKYCRAFDGRVSPVWKQIKRSPDLRFARPSKPNAARNLSFAASLEPGSSAWLRHSSPSPKPRKGLRAGRFSFKMRNPCSPPLQVK